MLIHAQYVCHCYNYCDKMYKSIKCTKGANEASSNPTPTPCAPRESHKTCFAVYSQGLTCMSALVKSCVRWPFHCKAMRVNVSNVRCRPDGNWVEVSLQVRCDLYLAIAFAEHAIPRSLGKVQPFIG